MCFSELWFWSLPSSTFDIVQIHVVLINDKLCYKRQIDDTLLLNKNTKYLTTGITYTVALICFDRFVYIWDTTSRRILYKLPGHAGSVNEVAFHPEEPVGESYSCFSSKALKRLV